MLAGKNPVIQNNFQHISQFEDNIDQEQNLLLNQPVQQLRRRKSQGSKNQKDSWKNSASPEWRPNKNLKTNFDPDAVASRARSKMRLILRAVMLIIQKK
jgi:hypothetical protein